MKNGDFLNAVKKFGIPIYLYDAEDIKDKCHFLKRNFGEVKLFYACKANTNPQIIKLIYKQGFGIETVSPGEIAIARRVGVPISKITFTCGSIEEEELIAVVKSGIRVHLDSLTQVEMFGRNFGSRKESKNISVRLNLMVGAGHHSHVITGGPDSKFAIDITQIGQLKSMAEKYNLKITGLHQHIGSNVLEVGTFIKGVRVILETALLFPDLKNIDFGGGLGIPYTPEEKKLNISLLAGEIKKEISKFTKKYGRRIETSIEPGRYIVAEAGSLVVKVNDKKHNPTKTFIGVNSGMNHLIRPAMYGSYHTIENLTAKSKKVEKVTVVGNICESGDILAKDRTMVTTNIGDILTIKNTGAYGYAMSSEYNSRPKPKEILFSNQRMKKI